MTNDPNEYKVRFRVVVPVGLFGKKVLTGLEIYVAYSAAEAIDIAKKAYEENALKEGLDIEDLPLEIVDVEKL